MREIKTFIICKNFFVFVVSIQSFKKLTPEKQSLDKAYIQLNKISK